MNEIDKQSWQVYAKTIGLSKEEQMDERLCEELRKTFGFANCRMWVAWGNLFNEILAAFGIKR